MSKKKVEPIWCPYCLANNEQHPHNEVLKEDTETNLIEYKVVQPIYSELTFTFFDLAQVKNRKAHQSINAPHFLYMCLKCNYPEIQEKLIL